MQRTSSYQRGTSHFLDSSPSTLKHIPAMRSRIALALGVVGLLASSACTEDFAEINTNPNAPTDVPASLLLRQVTYDVVEGMSYEGFTGGANLGHYFSADPGFNAFDRGDLLAPQFGGIPWPLLYRNLRDINIVLEKSRTSSTSAVYEGPALVMKTIIAGQLTDIFGDVPYTLAGEGRNGVVEPAYDTQESIYTGPEGLLANLTKAVEVMDAYRGAQALEGDILFAGKLDGWVRLANSLRLKYLLRASAELDASRLAAIGEIVQGGRYIQTAAQDAVYRFGSAPNDFRFARARQGDFNNYLMSETLDSLADALADPRQELWFRAATAGGFNGIRNGLAPGSSVDGASVSLPGRIWREDASKLKGNYMTAWETHFVLAEAAARGYYPGDAKALYEEGVRLAFAYWNVVLPEGYLTTGAATFDASKAVEQIVQQRWLASIGNGYEGWILWRRTGFPRFLAPLASLNGGMIPVRFPYPVNEQALNASNYAEAIGRLGGTNSPNVAVWWDE